MNLADMLRGQNIDLKDVIVLRHRPYEREFNKVFPRLIAERPDLFNLYQSTHSEKVEAALLKAKYVASFIAWGSKKALFIGLYSINDSRPITKQQYWKIPGHGELQKRGMVGFVDDSNRPKVHLFDLQLTDFYVNWSTKLVVSWPPPERSWWRRAHKPKNVFSIVCVHEESVVIDKRPNWRSVVLNWNELADLTPTWKAAFSEWRGVYFIFDKSDGKGYVGSASGHDNLLGRWLNYASDGDGGNKLLKHRNPEDFQFSILQRVSPDMSAKRVIRLENTWKERLHTKQPTGLNAN